MTNLEFPKGLYRLATPIRMKKGDSSFGVVCKSCDANLPMLEDRPGSDLKFVGKGELSIPCRFCLSEGIYRTSDLRRMKVEEDSTAPQRVIPSGNYRRRLIDAYPGVMPTFGANFVEMRPEAAIIIARCISLWSEVEAACASLVLHFVGPKSEAAASMFLAIRNGRTQFEVMCAAAEISLKEDDLRLFRAIMLLKERVERERNSLAHGHYGFAPVILRGLAWVSMEDFARKQIKRQTGKQLVETVYVYEPEDLETIAQEIEELIGTVRQFNAYLGWPEGHRRLARFQQICKIPLVGEALQDLDDRQRNREAQKKRQRRGNNRPLKESLFFAYCYA